jgi:hypothetical protein
MEPSYSAEPSSILDVLDLDVLLLTSSWLGYRDLTRFSLTSKKLYGAIANDELVWKHQCLILWRDKVYVPKEFQDMVQYPGISPENRLDLFAWSVKAVRTKLLTLNVPRHRIAACIEKTDLVRLLSDHYRSSFTGALAKRALQLSLLDSKRCAITAEEITSFIFNIRLRADGVLGNRIRWCAWHNGRKELMEARFSTDGTVKFVYPEGYNPFGDMIDPDFRMGWDVILNGKAIQLTFGGSPGPQELVVRHPTNWGFMLMNGGTVWTGFPMPPKGEDPHIEDAAVRHVLGEAQQSMGGGFYAS